MDWSNEEYVRLYTRDTDDWVCMPWQSRALLPLLMRKMDRAGVFATKRGPSGVAALVSMPIDVVEAGIEGLLEDGCVQQHPRGYVMVNFLDAQEATKSDKLRQKESRRRRRDGSDHDVTNRDSSVTNRDETSRAVTSGHEESQPVTTCHSPSAPSAPSALLPPSDLNTHTGDEPISFESDTVVARLPLPARDLRAEVIRDTWSEYAAAHKRCRDALAGGAGFGAGAHPVGQLGQNLLDRLEDFRKSGCDYPDCAARMLWLVQVAEVKALRDSNMAHMSKTFDREEAKYAMNVTDLTDLARQTPSRMAKGTAAQRRIQETTPKTNRPPEPPPRTSRPL